MIGLVLLAAGASSRMRGKQKQLLPFDPENSLLRHSATVALDSVCRPIVIVLGANAVKLCDEIADLEIDITINNNWNEGIGSSIAAGVAKLIELAPASTGVVIALADQPFVTAELLNNLVETHHTTAAPIVAAEYNQTLGAPTLFHSDFFPELLALTGDAGAKRVIAQHPNNIARVIAPQASLDIDTPEDYVNFLRKC